MTSRRTVWAAWVVCATWTISGSAAAQSPRDAVPAPVAAMPVPLDDLTPADRARVRAVLDQPTLRSHGRVETFTCQPAVYDWLLDHPDLAVRLWRLLGAKCGDIVPDGADSFVWKDGPSHIHWDTVLKRSGLRIWYAEGEVRPGLLLPGAKVKAVAVLRYTDGHTTDGRPTLRHQVELTLHTDSHAVALAARILGASAPHAGEQMVGQIEMFYAALAWYLDQHPGHAETLFAQIRQSPAGDAPPKFGPKPGS
jgi:hypothetical protein